MHIIQQLQEKFNLSSINKHMLGNIKNIINFKKKILVLPVCALVISSWIFCSGYFYDNHLDGTFAFVIFLTCYLGVVCHFLLSKLSVNGWFLKSVSYLFKQSTILKSFISTEQYQDTLILSTFEKTDVKQQMLAFYEFLSRINFSHSEPIDNIYFSNEEIAYNMEKLMAIIDSNDAQAFLKFFKTRFLSNFVYYSQHKFVTYFTQQSNDNSDNFIDTSSLLVELDHVVEPLNLKHKFKTVL